MSAIPPTSAPAPRDTLTQAEARLRHEQVSHVCYLLEFELGEASGLYQGRASIQFRRSGTGGTFLDFTRGRILRAELNGNPLVVDPSAHPYRLALPSHQLESDNEVRLSWESPYDRTGVGLHRFQDPEDGGVYLFTDLEPYNAHRVFPCFDQPDLKATYDVTVVAPASWIVVSNGCEVSTEMIPGGQARRRFATLPPFSTYLFALIAGPYSVVEDLSGPVALRLLCRKSLRPHLDAAEILDVTRRGFDFYSEHFGYPYAFGKYDQIFVPEYNSGAMENVGAVTFHEAYIFRDPPTDTQRLARAEVILHELAHMWFGNLVTMRWWDDLWLNESFATYISFVAMSKATRFQDAFQNFLGRIKTWAYREDQKPSTHPIAGRVDDTEQTFLNFDGITYGKGAAVLKQLSHDMGENLFRDGLRLYFRAHAFGNTTLTDFFGALGEAAGRDLNPWVDAWVRTAGLNDLWAGAEGGEIILHQGVGNGDRLLRPHRLTVAEYGSTDQEVVRRAHWDVFIEQDRIAVGAAEEAPPELRRRLYWANQGDHGYARVLLDDLSTEFLTHDLHRVPDPMTRMGLWCTAWELVRDGRLGPAEHVALVMRSLVHEVEPEIVDSNLRLAQVSLTRYLAPERQVEVGSALVAVVRDALAHHRTGSDLQLLWARALPSLITHSADAEALLSWLDGTTPPGEVPIDQGLRWKILARAAAHALPGVAERLESESTRDPSDRGVKARFLAEAAQPDPQIKRSLFERFQRPRPEDSADLLKAGMAAFFQPHQSAILEPLGDAWFAALPEVLRTQDLEYATRGFARLLVPHAIASPSLVRAAQEALAQPGLSPVLQRVLVEEADEMDRATRLRAQSRA